MRCRESSATRASSFCSRRKCAAFTADLERKCGSRYAHDPASRSLMEATFWLRRGAFPKHSGSGSGGPAAKLVIAGIFSLTSSWGRMRPPAWAWGHSPAPPDVWAMGFAGATPLSTPAGADVFLFNNTTGGGRTRTTRDRLVPSCMSPPPPLAHVGLSERQAQRDGIAVRVAKLPMSAVLRTEATDETQGFMKALVGRDDDLIRGFTMIGAEAGGVMGAGQKPVAAKHADAQV